MKRVLILFMFSIISLYAFEELNPQNIEAKLKNKNVILDFYADWCHSCKILDKTLIKFDKVKPSNIVIYKIDIMKHKDLVKKYKVRQIPTLVYVKNSKVITKELGLKSVDELISNSKKYFK